MLINFQRYSRLSHDFQFWSAMWSTNNSPTLYNPFLIVTIFYWIIEDTCIPTTMKRKRVIVLAELSIILYPLLEDQESEWKFQSIYMNWSDVWTKFWNDKSNTCICTYSFCRFFMPEIMCCNFNVLIITTDLYISISLNFDLFILLLLRTCVDYNVNPFPVMLGLRIKAKRQTNRWLIKIADITAIHNKHKS